MNIYLGILAAVGALVTAVMHYYGYFKQYQEEETPDVIYIPQPPKPPVLPQEASSTPETLIVSTNPKSTMTNQEKLYEAAAKYLGTHQTLNDNVPPELGCAEALSSILKHAGVSGIPTLGFPGTASLYDWLRGNPAFEAVNEPAAGVIILSVTGQGNGNARGHTGIVAAYGKQYAGDYGICSNNSDTGQWSEQWQLSKWKEYYETYGGLPTHFFVWKG